MFTAWAQSRHRLRLPFVLSLACAATFFGATAAGAGTSAEGSASKVVRAALPPGKINYILLIEMENEGYDVTFGPTSPAHYLNTTLRKDGELLQNYYAVGHASL